MEILAGDIGGTHSRLRWASVEPGGAATTRFEADYASADFADANALLARFFADAANPLRPVRAALALPGAVAGDTVRLTNLAWTLDAAALKSAFGFAEVRFLNDFQAAARGVALLTPDDLVTLNPGDTVALNPGDPAASNPAALSPVTPSPIKPSPIKHGTRAITGAGTGLGVGYMTPTDSGWDCHASEGGHTDFSPANARQDALLAQLRREHAHVSWERVVSGLGFDALYRFCCAELGQPPADLACGKDQGDETHRQVYDGARVSALAGAGDAAADATLDFFVELYGAWLGNLALLYRPASGLYIAGGVALHLQDRMQHPRFLDAAFAKGRMRGVVQATPIYLITNKRLGLMGALHAGLEAVRHRSTA